RLPRKAECAASDEHRPPPLLPCSPLPDAIRTKSVSARARPVMIRTAGENSILLTPWADLTAPCDQAKGQKRRLGIEAHCLGSDLPDHVNIIDPERPGRQHLKP